VGEPRVPTMVAIISRIFRNEQMHWTLQATCAVCLRETIAPLLMSVPVRCSGCGLLVKIDPTGTVFRRSEGTGCAREPLRRFRWGFGVLRVFLPGRK
jgi:hypothetical protein